MICLICNVTFQVAEVASEEISDTSHFDALST